MSNFLQVRAFSPPLVELPRLRVVTAWRCAIIFIVERFVAVCINTAELASDYVTIRLGAHIRRVQRTDFIVIDYLGVQGCF